jgi:hypothetical protein
MPPEVGDRARLQPPWFQRHSRDSKADVDTGCQAWWSPSAKARRRRFLKCGSRGLFWLRLGNEWGVMDREDAHQVLCVALDLLF